MNQPSKNLIKEINLNHVRRVMKQVQTATKPQLSALTKLSVVTINSLVKDLVKYGELLEDELVSSSGGRPALNYRYNFNYHLALVLYMREYQGQDTVVATVINLQGDVLAREDYVMALFEKERLYAIINQFLVQYPSINVIGLGIPGQSVHGEITVSSHERLNGIRIIEDLQQEFGLPVVLENDVNAAVVGYCVEREPEEEQTVVGIYFPDKTPPGMGIYLDGRIVKGKDGMAGEIKFLPLHADWGSSLDFQAFAEVVSQTIHITNAILAPHKIVIYQQQMNPADWAQYWKEYRAKHNMPVEPEVLLETTFQEDFEIGMKWLTLKELEPSITIADE
ncbi:ROK family protein [Paenibacillus agri]|uniref:ROK family protein n=1 Tax=Paenibacillus agri TaxID=2744309 RepID=A0A850EQY0_9BACL|nr:ROK family protein [Paenibacillus agri]NUU62180.1 ROK family protein [Paenibacillus agri]